MKVITGKDGQKVPIKAWVDGVELEEMAVPHGRTDNGGVRTSTR